MTDQTEQSEKTEEPILKKLEEVYKCSDVVKSIEVNTWFVLLTITLLCSLFPKKIFSLLSQFLTGFIEKAHIFSLDEKVIEKLWLNTGKELFLILSLPILFLVVSAILGNVIQYRIVWSFVPIKPKLSKISLLKGLKRLFSPEAFINFLKDLIKLFIISVLMITMIWLQIHQLDLLILSSS